MVLVGKVNKEIVGLINRHGGTRRRPLGPGRRLITAEVKEHHDLDGNLLDLGYVGSVDERRHVACSTCSPTT